MRHLARSRPPCTPAKIGASYARADALNRRGTTNPLQTHAPSTTTASQLRDGLVLAVVTDTIQTAREEGSQRVGVIGRSLGGWLALLHAQERGSGCGGFLLRQPRLGRTWRHPCPVLLQLAGIDSWPAGADPEDLILHLKNHGTPVTEYTYPGTEHSFANESLPDKWDPTASGARAYDGVPR